MFEDPVLLAEAIKRKRLADLQSGLTGGVNATTGAITAAGDRADRQQELKRRLAQESRLEQTLADKETNAAKGGALDNELKQTRLDMLRKKLGAPMGGAAPDNLPAPLGPSGQPFKLDDAGDAMPGARAIMPGGGFIGPDMQSNVPKDEELINKLRAHMGLEPLESHAQEAHETPADEAGEAAEPLDEATIAGLKGSFGRVAQDLEPDQPQDLRDNPDLARAFGNAGQSLETGADIRDPETRMEAAKLAKAEADVPKAQALATIATKKAARATAAPGAGTAKPPKGSITVGGETGKPMSAHDVDRLISAPRHLLDSLDELANETPEMDTGARKTAEDVAEHIPGVGGLVKGAIQGDQQAGFDAKIDAALAAVNNAMDQRVNQHTLALWKKRIVDAAQQGPDAYKQALQGVKAEAEDMLSKRESDLRASGYLVPKAKPTAGGITDAVSAKKAYAAFSDDQKENVKALIARGVDRVEAVKRVAAAGD